MEKVGTAEWCEVGHVCWRDINFHHTHNSQITLFWTAKQLKLPIMKQLPYLRPTYSSVKLVTDRKSAPSNDWRCGGGERTSVDDFEIDAGSSDQLDQLNTWVTEYGSDVLNLAYSYVKNYHVAQDITQDVFLRAFTKIETFRGDSGVKTWLLSITANRCKDYLRSWVVRHETNDLTLQTEAAHQLGDDTEQAAIGRLERDALWQLVHRLPVKYREVILLFYQRELSSAEVAQTLGISEATVRTRLHRGRTLMREWMEGGERR